MSASTLINIGHCKLHTTDGQRLAKNQRTSAGDRGSVWQWHVPVDVVDTLPVVLTRLGVALIDLCLAIDPTDPWETLARVPIDHFDTCAIALTWIRITLLDFCPASFTYTHTCNLFQLVFIHFFSSCDLLPSSSNKVNLALKNGCHSCEPVTHSTVHFVEMLKIFGLYCDFCEA